MATNRRRRVRVMDREATPVLTNEQIGPKRSLTHEGFLLCQDVPLARVGQLRYSAGETPVTVDAYTGIAMVDRDHATLFAPETISSFSGKPVTNEHPHELVTADNCRKYSVGVVLNPHQGEGPDNDILLGDLLIMDRQAILDVQAGKREVSAGYEAEYEQTGPGQGRQTDILGNHVALVQRGRCGPRCAVGDHSSTATKESTTMGQRVASKTRVVVPKAAATVRQIFRDAENEALAAMGMEPSQADEPDDDDMTDGDGNHIHVHLHGAGGGAGEVAAKDELDPTAGAGATEGGESARIGKLETAFADLAAMVKKALGMGGAGAGEGATKDADEADLDPEEEEDKKMATTDSVALQTGYQAMIAHAEILIPGFRVSTFDAKMKRAATVDMMCATRRRVLDTLYATADGQALVNTVHGAEPKATLDLAKMDCAAVAGLFKSAAGAKALLNNQRATHDAQRPGAKTADTAGAKTYKPVPSTPAEVQAINDAFWKNK